MEQKRIRIKDIARLAGVSSGTVDRILHGRGNVSSKSREAVKKVLKEVDYRPNIHISSISLKKTYNIIFIAPGFTQGEYWDSIHSGILRALDEYQNISVNFKTVLYNQYDVYASREVFSSTLLREIDAVIIGPIFQQETQEFCKDLDEREIPYVFVDSKVDGTHPLAHFSSNHYMSGYLMSKLVNAIMPPGCDIGIMQAKRVGDASANSTILRKNGFSDFITENNINRQTLRIPFSPIDDSSNEEQFDAFFEENKNVGGIVVLNSRGHMMANYLSKRNRKDIKLICVDITASNRNALKNGYIDFLIGQKPERQGYLAMKFLIEHLIYKIPIIVENILPLDILTKETVDLYNEFNDLVYLDKYE